MDSFSRILKGVSSFSDVFLLFTAKVFAFYKSFYYVELGIEFFYNKLNSWRSKKAPRAWEISDIINTISW